MKVELVRYTSDPQQLVKNAIDITTLKDMGENIIQKVIGAGAESVIEHVYFTFKVTGVSRVLTHQLVRHRIASYTQESQRYVNYAKKGGWKYVTPPRIAKKEETKKIFNDLMGKISSIYNKLIEKGIPPEDARFVLPNACCTSIYITMNCRSLRNFFKVRIDKRAQWEIRELAEKMLELVKPIAPQIFSDIVPEKLR